MSARSSKVVRELLGNKARTVLVVAALAIGLTGLSTTLFARAIFTSNLDAEIAAINPSSATILTEGADTDAVELVDVRDDTAGAVGRQVAFGRIQVGDELRPLRVVIQPDFLGGQAIDRIRPEDGSWPPPPGTIALERSSLDASGLAIGDTATVVDPTGGSHELAVSGTAYDLTVVSGKLVDQVVFAYVTDDTWQQMGQTLAFNEIVFTVADDPLDEAHIADVAQQAADEVAAEGFAVNGITIPPPGEHVLDNVVSSLLLILGALGLLSLVLSAFLIFNTVSAMLARQRSQIGVMKAVGASRRDVLTLYLLTIGALAVLSLLVAVPAGALAGRLLTNQLGALLNIDVHRFAAPAWVWIVMLSVGLAVPLLAALGPILSGTRATVAEAIRGSESGVFGTSRIDRALARLGRLPTSLRYAARNTFRRKARLALTVVALSLGGAILVTVMTLRSSLFETVDSIEAYWQQDVTVDLQGPEPFADVERAVASTDELADVEGWLIVPSSVVRPDGGESGAQTIVFGVPPDSAFIDATMVAGRYLEADDEGVVVNVDVRANEPGLSVGDDITLRIGDTEVTREVVGISTTQLVAPGEPRPAAPIAYAPYEQLDAGLGSTGLVNRLVVSGTAHDAAAQVDLAARVEASLGASQIPVRAVDTRSAMRAQVERLTTPILLMLSAMAVVFALVGGLGLLGTMSLNVLERTTEFGMVRSVGATGGTVLSIVLVEGLTVAGLSWALGSLMAVPMGWVMAQSVGVSFIKVPLEFRFAPIGVALWLAMAVVVAIVSSWLPARGASRLSVRDAIAYE